MSSRQPLTTDADLELRRARADDAALLHRLAALDSQPPPRGDAAHLLALARGQVIAAVALDGTWQAADPFARSAAALELLRHRREQLCGRATRRRARGLVKRVRAGAAAG